MPMARVNDLDMHYEVRGEGPWLIAISGLLSTTQTSQFQLVPGLHERYRVLYADHRGGGRSAIPAGPYSIDDIADDWLGLMDRLGIDAAPVMGNSMGGMAALTMAAHRPERVTSLVLSCTAAWTDPFLRMLVETWSETFSNVGLKAWSKLVTLCAASPTWVNANEAALLDTLSNLPDTIDAEGYAAQCAALTAFDGRSLLPTITQPALVLSGERDFVCRPELGRELAAALPNARFASLPEAGHLAQQEAPMAYADALFPFLDELS